MARIPFLLLASLILALGTLLVAADLKKVTAPAGVQSLSPRHHSSKGSSGGSTGGSGHSGGGGSSGHGSGGGSSGGGSSGGSSGASSDDPMKGSGGTDKLGCESISPLWDFVVKPDSLKSCYSMGSSIDLQWSLGIRKGGKKWDSSGLVFQIGWGFGQDEFKTLFWDGKKLDKHCAADGSANLPLDAVPSTATWFKLSIFGYNGVNGGAPLFFQSKNTTFGKGC